jgi:2-(1,2-epoxy-1,2-dihydrophenyl)acetyl-CoA isomerase
LSAEIEGAGETVAVVTDGHAATVTLRRPGRLNALTPPMLGELRAVLESISGNREIRAVVLTGAGRAFCAGGDVGTMATTTMSADFVRETVAVTEVFYELPQVTIAAVNGPCAGGGMALACAADLRVAASSAFFVTAFLGVGTSGDMGLPWHLVRLVGLGAAKELSLLGDRISADRAASLGLVSRVVPDADLGRAAGEMAARVAAYAPGAVARMNANLDDALGLDLSAFLDVESRRYAENARSADAQEAVRALLERRLPVFTGDEVVRT